MDQWYYQRNKKLRKTRYEVDPSPKKNLKLELGAAALNDIVLREQEGHIMELEMNQSSAAAMQEEAEQRLRIVFVAQVEFGHIILQHISLMRSTTKLEQNLQQTKLMQEVDLKYGTEKLASEQVARESQRKLLQMVEDSGRTEREQQLKSWLQWKNEHESSLRQEFQALAATTRDHDQRLIATLQTKNTQLDGSNDSLARQIKDLQNEKQELLFKYETSNSTQRLQQQSLSKRVEDLEFQVERERQQHLTEIRDLSSQRDSISVKHSKQKSEIISLNTKLSDYNNTVIELNQSLSDIHQARSCSVSTGSNTIKTEVVLIETTFKSFQKQSVPTEMESTIPTIVNCDQFVQTDVVDVNPKTVLKETIENSFVKSDSQKKVLKSTPVRKGKPSPSSIDQVSVLELKTRSEFSPESDAEVAVSPSLVAAPQDNRKPSDASIPSLQHLESQKSKTSTNVISSIRRRFNSGTTNPKKSEKKEINKKRSTSSASSPPESPIGCFGRFKKKISRKKNTTKESDVKESDNLNYPAVGESPIQGSSIVNRACERTGSLTFTTLDAVTDGQSDVAEAATRRSDFGDSSVILESPQRENRIQIPVRTPFSDESLSSTSTSLSTASSSAGNLDMTAANLTLPSSPPPLPPQLHEIIGVINEEPTTQSKHYFDDSD